MRILRFQGNPLPQPIPTATAQPVVDARETPNAAHSTVAETPFFPPVIPALDRVRVFKRFCNGIARLFREKEPEILQEAKVSRLLGELHAKLKAGQIKILAHHLSPLWAEHWDESPFGPVTLQIGDRVYSLRKKYISHEYGGGDDYYILKSQDGRFKIQFRELQNTNREEVSYSPNFRYRDNVKGVKLKAVSGDPGRLARTLFRKFTALVKENYDSVLAQTHAQVAQQEAPAF